MHQPAPEIGVFCLSSREDAIYDEVFRRALCVTTKHLRFLTQVCYRALQGVLFLNSMCFFPTSHFGIFWYCSEVVRFFCSVVGARSRASYGPGVPFGDEATLLPVTVLLLPAVKCLPPRTSQSIPKISNLYLYLFFLQIYDFDTQIDIQTLDILDA